MGGSTYVDGSSTSDVIAYQGQNSMSGKSQAPLQEIPYDEQGDVADYISSHLESAGGAGLCSWETVHGRLFQVMGN